MPEKAGRIELNPGILQVAPQGINYLLVIAIDAYIHCPPLYNCVKDAHDLIVLLTDRYRFERQNIKELYNQQATKSNIYRTFREMAQRITPNDNLLIYFSGHGEYDKIFKQGYWIPVEALQDNHDQYIPNSEIKTFLSAINSHHTFLMSDSCFSGALFAKGVAKNIEKRYEHDPSRWGLTAGRNEIVSDGQPGDNSPFAESLLYRLRQNSGSIGVQELCAHVTEYVQAKTNQTPIGEPLKVEGHKNGQFVFHLKKDEIRDWTEVSAENSILAYERYLQTYPDGKHRAEARQRIEQLQDEEAWQYSLQQNTLSAYLYYYGQFPRGRYKQEALNRIEQLEEERDWKSALQLNSIAAFLRYQHNYPKGKYHQEARECISKLQHGTLEDEIWLQAKSNSTAEAYESYLTQYPKGKYAAQAKALIESFTSQQQQADSNAPTLKEVMIEPVPIVSMPDRKKEKNKSRPQVIWYPIAGISLVFVIGLSIWLTNPSLFSGSIVDEDAEEKAWLMADSLHTVESYRDYLSNYASGLYRSASNDSITAIQNRTKSEQDYNDWMHASQWNNVAAYQHYLTLHPDGTYAGVARDSLGAMKGRIDNYINDAKVLRIIGETEGMKSLLQKALELDPYNEEILDLLK